MRIVTKIELIVPWSMPYPGPRNFVKIRSQLFQLSDGETNSQTYKQTEVKTKLPSSGFGGGNEWAGE